MQLLIVTATFHVGAENLDRKIYYWMHLCAKQQVWCFTTQEPCSLAFYFLEDYSMSFVT